MRSIHWLLPAATILMPLAAPAQMSDAAYCKALTQRYEVYISNMSIGRSPGTGTVDGNVAIEQCKAGNTAAGIPVLEKKLRDARIDLPLRG
jgi:hypothetical protein